MPAILNCVFFSISEFSQSLAKLSTTLDSIHSWFCVNRLAVNPSKTKYLRIDTLQQRSKVTHYSVYFQNLAHTPTDSARNLGVTFDSSMDCQIVFLSIADILSFKSDSCVISVPHSAKILPLS